MTNIFGTNNPGIGGIDELTSTEELFIQNLAGLSYAQGDVLYHNGTAITRLAVGTAFQVLGVNAGATAITYLNVAPRGTLPISTTGGTTTLTATQFQNMAFDVTGVLTSNAIIEIPDNFSQMFVVDNETTGAYTLTVKHSASAAQTIPQGEKVLLYTTGSVIETVTTTGSGTGTVTSVSVVTANGVSGSVATSTTTPAITLTLGAITPSSVQVSGLTASELTATDASKNLVSLAVATYPSLTELSYVKGVTSAIQTQLGTKAPTASPTFTGTVTLPVGLTGVIRADTGVVSVDTDVTDLVTAGTDTAAGKLELATDAETVTGTDTARATTPANITAKMAAPGAIGGTTASTGKFTTVETTGGIELGHATDTSITRVSAGVAAIEGDTITTLTATQTLSGKTLTAPKIVDAGFIADANGNEQLVFQTTASAVNEFEMTNAATGGTPILAVTGGDANINMQLTPKGTGIVKGELKRFMVQLLANTTDQTVSSTIGGDFRISNRAITVKAVGAYCDTAGTTGTFTVDINEAGVSILSTKITVDSTEKSSETAATAPVISDSAIAADAIITFDIDAIQTTAAKGLKVWVDYVYA